MYAVSVARLTALVFLRHVQQQLRYTFFTSNAVKRSIWHQCDEYCGLTTDRPTNLTSWIISNSHISTIRYPIHARAVLGCRLTFSGSADRMALFSVGSNPRWRPAVILENFKWPCGSNGATIYSLVLNFRHRWIMGEEYVRLVTI